MSLVKDIELIEAATDYKILISELAKGKYIKVNESFYTIVDKSPVKDIIVEYQLKQFVLNGEVLETVNNDLTFTDKSSLENKLKRIVCGKVIEVPSKIPEFKSEK